MRTPHSALTLVTTVALAGLAVLLLLLTLTAVPLVHGGEPESITDRDELVIGVGEDLPGLSSPAADGRRTGFEADVATYIAGRLGLVPEDDLTFRPLGSEEPESALNEGTVDMVIAAYPVTAERKDRVTFAGPYYLAHQDILVRQDERSIDDVRDLRGKKVCQVTAADSWRQVTGARELDADPFPAGSYGDCVEALADGRVDAVSADDLILAGLANTTRGVTVVNAPFTDVKYGIGLREGDLEGCRAVNRILTGMYQNGAAATMLDQWFATSGLELATTVPQLEGCA